MLFLFLDQHNYNRPQYPLRGATCESMLLQRHLFGYWGFFIFQPKGGEPLNLTGQWNVRKSYMKGERDEG
jgi:hypothetical protein